MSLGIGHVAQIAISVGDMERAKAFYRDVLGLTHLFDAPPGLSFFQCGQVRLMLSRPEGAGTGNSIVYYGVPDAAAAEHQLAAKSVVFEESARCIARMSDREIWLAVCRDSEGNLLGLMSERVIAAD